MTAISVMVRERQSLEMVIAMKECTKMEKGMDLEYIGIVILCNLQYAMKLYVIVM